MRFSVPHMCYMSYSSHPHRFDNPHNIVVKSANYEAVLCNSLKPRDPYSLLGVNILSTTVSL